MQIKFEAKTQAIGIAQKGFTYSSFVRLGVEYRPQYGGLQRINERSSTFNPTPLTIKIKGEAGVEVTLVPELTLTLW